MFFRSRRELEPVREEVAPEDLPPSRSELAHNPLIATADRLLSFLLVLALASAGALYYGKRAFETPGPLQADKIVIVARGGLQDIADQLEREGVITRPLVFQAGVTAFQARDKLKAGEYLFPKQASLKDVMDVLVEGKAVEHTITIPEGLTSEQIVERLKAEEALAGNIRQTPREGSLLPETYKFTRGMTREQITDRMAQAQKKALDEVWKKRAPDTPYRSPDDLVVLASIVEKETGKPDERPRVAAVFLNRLAKHMRLQSDPTIIYGLVGGKGTLGRPLTRADVETRSPYNTYVIDGLPPGPIANPGKASLEAAANPAKTKDLYFVADGTGGHAFAENLGDHNRNVARWRDLDRSAPADAADPAEPAAPEAAPTDPAARAASPTRPRPSTTPRAATSRTAPAPNTRIVAPD